VLIPQKSITTTYGPASNRVSDPDRPHGRWQPKPRPRFHIWQRCFLKRCPPSVRENTQKS